jgi:hypothetical protein
MSERFTLYKEAEFPKKPWIVADTAADACEDPVLYRFSSARKAREFKAMMDAERGIATAAVH